jgi:nucleoside-diphosphate-sugar epimerase
MILVTGATGMLGAHFLLHLAQQKQQLRAVYREQSKREMIRAFFDHNKCQDLFASIEWVKVSLDNLAEVEEALEGVKQVIHCAALISFNPKDEKRLFKANVAITKVLVNALLDKPVKLLYISSVAALESDERSYYGHSKCLGELEVFRGIQEGLDAWVVRPGVILSDFFWKSPSLALFKLAFRIKDLCFSGVTGFIAAEDVVKCSLILMQQQEQRDVTLVSHHLTYCTLINLIRGAVGKSAAHRALGKEKLLAIMRLSKIMTFLGFKRLVLSEGLINTLYAENHYKILSEYSVFEDLETRDFEAYVTQLALNYQQFRRG